MIASLLAAAYATQLGAKALLADRYARGQSSEAATNPAGTTRGTDRRRVAIVQPILSGDPALTATLHANVIALTEAEFVWLVDEDDLAAQAIATQLVQQHATRIVRVVTCPPVPQGINPKAHKLALGLAHVDAPILVVLDDDTRLSEPALRALLAGLDSGAALATGLPCYHAAVGRWSGWLAEFVNSAAVLTYLPALAFIAPITIHGMCYALRTADVRELNLFAAIRASLTDDLALARELRRRGLRIVQTTMPHDIATSVASLDALKQILQRWFVFTRLLLADCPVRMRVGVTLAYGMPPLLLLALVVLAMTSLPAAALLGAVFLLREGVLRWVKRRFFGQAVPHRPLASFALELAQPALLVAAASSRTISWRKRRIRLCGLETFEYV